MTFPDDELTDAERAALAAHNAPPPFPAESIWGAMALEERRRASGAAQRHRLLALAASLALLVAGGSAGYVIGRAERPADVAPPMVAAPASDSTLTVIWF